MSLTSETKTRLISGSGPESITVPLGLGSSSAQRRGTKELWGDCMQRAEEVTVNEHLWVSLDFYHHTMKPSYHRVTSVK